MRLCILCQEKPATTGEHLFKSDIYQAVTGDGRAWMYRDNTPLVALESRNAPQLKPRKNLCGSCNNTTSIKPDRAISEAHRYFHGMLGENQKDDFQRKIESKGKRFGIDLKRYFAKALACKLDQYDLSVPPVLGRIFKQSLDHEHLHLEFDIHSDFEGSQILEAGPIVGHVPREFEPTATEWVRAGNIPDVFQIYFVYGAIRYSLLLDVPIAERTRV